VAKSLVQLLTEAQLVEIVEKLYEAVMDDPLLAPIFVNVDRRRQVQRLIGFVRMNAEPGSEPFDGPFLRDAHQHLQLTNIQYERRHAVIVRAIHDCGHGDDVVAAWSAFDARWRTWVLAAARVS
jgi:truncated hemoglobin YjbI